MSSLLNEDLVCRIGEKVVYHAPEEIGRAAIRYFALAVGASSPLHTDVVFARAHGYEDIVAPPTLVVESNQYMDAEPDADGYIGHSWGIELSGTRLIRGGHDYEFYGPVYPHHRLTVEWTLADVYEKEARDGRKMLLVESEARFSEQSGQALALNRETLIYQPLT